MNCYEQLIETADNDNIAVEEITFETEKLKGLCVEDSLYIDKKIETQVEKRCVLAEELGHYYTTVGNITKQETVQARKQENIARRWGFNKLLSINNILDAFKNGCFNRYEMAEYLNITEEYLVSATEYFAAKYGEMIEIDDYIIKFSPLNIYTKNPLFHTC